MKIGAIATLVNHISLRVSVKYKLLEFWISDTKCSKRLLDQFQTLQLVARGC